MKFTAIKNLIQPALQINRRNLVIVFLLSLLFRLAVGLPNLINLENAFTGDSNGYLSLAESIKQLSFPSLFRTPGYPLFIALTTTSLMPGNVIFTLLAQILLDSVASLLLVRICRRLFNLESAAILAGVLYAFSPVAAANSALLMSETTHVFFTLAAIYILVSSDSVKAMIGQAVFWAFATLIRPSGIFFPIISYFLINSAKTKRDWKKQTAAIILYAVIILGWCGFNYARAGRFVFSTVQSAALYKYELSAVQMLEDMSILEYVKLWVIDPRKGEPIRDKYEIEFYRQVYNRETTADDRWNSFENVELNDKLEHEAEARLKGKYLSRAVVHLIGALQIFRPISPTASSGILGTLLDGFRTLLFSLAAILLLWRRELSFWTFVSISFWLAYTFFIPGVNGIWRFRATSEPIVCIIIALGILSFAGVHLFADGRNNNLNKIDEAV